MSKSAIKNQENHLTEILDRISDGFVALDKNWCFTYINKKAAEIVGRDPDEMLGKNMWEEFPALKENPSGIQDAYQQSMKDQKSIAVETYYEPFGKWFETYIYPAAGGLTIYFKDITNKKKTEDGINKIQQETEALINNTSDLLWSVRNDYTLITANRPFIKGLKENSGFLVKPGDNILSPEYFPDDYLQYWKNFYDKGLAGESVNAQVYTPQVDKPDFIWFELKIDPIIIDEKIKGIACSMRNISDRKKAEQGLIESENRLNTILQTEPECVKILNEHGELLDMNPAGLAMIEAENLESVKGRQMLGLINDTYKKKFAALTKEIFNGKTGILEFEITGIKGTKRWLETHAVPLKDAAGKIISLLGVTRDITLRKKAEEEIKKNEEKITNLNNVLEQKVKERTAELETVNAELIEINDLFVGREAWIIELKEEVEKLKLQLKIKNTG